jgi:hemolysin D
MSADHLQLMATLEALKAQRDEKRAQRTRLTNTISNREQLLKILKERVDIRQIIDDSQQGFRARVIDALQEYLRELTNLSTDQGQLAEAEASLASIERKFDQARSEFLSEQTQKLNEAERKRDRLFHEWTKLDTKARHMVLRAPISGTIQQLAITTLGQVVMSGQALMTVVPTDRPIEVEAMVVNSEIGFVRLGQSAVVKIDAFPFTRFGTLTGTVSKISREAVDTREASGLADSTAVTRPQGTQPQTSGFAPSQTLVFPITVTLDRAEIAIEDRKVPLQAGMAATVEIQTGRRKVIDFLLSPLKEVLSTSGHER